jgi:single-strand DNA-binding protein
VSIINKIIISGNLGKPPETRYTQSGKAVASFDVAVRRDKENTDWISVVCWEKLAELVGNSLDRGSRVLVEGRLQIRHYEDKDKNKRKVAEVIAQNIEFLDKREKDEHIPFAGVLMPEDVER